MREHGQRAPVIGPPADIVVEARRGFDVVVEHLGAGGEHHLERLAGAHEIRDKNLDLATGNTLVNGADHQGKQSSATVGAVVTIDACNHGVAEFERGDGLGHAAWLVEIHLQRRAFLHRAKAAPPCADVPQDHERRRAAAPALTDVGARGALANRVQSQVADQTFQLAVVFTRRGRGADPFRTRARRTRMGPGVGGRQRLRPSRLDSNEFRHGPPQCNDRRKSRAITHSPAHTPECWPVSHCRCSRP